MHNKDSGNTVVQLYVNASSGSSSSFVSDSDLSGIIRPWYLQHLLDENVTIDSTYGVHITQENKSTDTCHFWLGAGSDCSQVCKFL